MIDCRVKRGMGRAWVAMMGVGLLLAVLLPGPAGAQDFNMAGVQVWNVGYWDTVEVGDYMGPNYKCMQLAPIKLVGARNGTYSGAVVITNSLGAIEGLKAKASDLVTEDGDKIPANRVRVRYPELHNPAKSWTHPYRFDGLADSPPEIIDVVYHRDPVRGWKPKHPGPVATQPIWVTVAVPPDAKPGDYAGKLTIEGENLAVDPMVVSIRLTVHDWRLPDPKEFTVRNMGWLSPERVADYYKAPMWSDRHFELMGKSLEMMLQLGSRQVQVNLVTRYPSIDNTETMVTWIKQSDGSFKYDFTVFDRYMDLAAKVIGKPFPVRLNMWTVERRDTGLPQVRVLDPATGKVSEMDQPTIGTPESLAFWKPVLDEIRVRMEKRGWFDVTTANWIEYCGGPTPEAVDVLHRIWPDGKWSSTDHGRRTGFKGATEGVFMPVLVGTTVWNEGAVRHRGYKDGLSRGARTPEAALCGHARGRTREWFDLWSIRGVPEEQIMKGNPGVDPLGGDLWPIQTGRGRYSPGAWAAFALGPGNCTKAFLAPGPDGAIATERFEALREGIQIAEAILFIQAALNSGKLDAKTAEQANRVLDARSQKMLDAWPVGQDGQRRQLNQDVFSENAQEREGELYATAAAVAKALGTGGATPAAAPAGTGGSAAAN